jgi:hypothetical protein
MLNNLTNFLSIIAKDRIKKKLEPSDIIAIGTKQSSKLGDYKPTAIVYADLENQIKTEVLSNIPAPVVVQPLYKTLQLKVSQSGSSVPTVTVLNNDFPGLTFTSNYATTGMYYLEFNQSIFNASTTFWLVSPAVASHIGCSLTGSNIFQIKTRLFNGTMTDGILNNTLIEIRVYS